MSKFVSMLESSKEPFANMTKGKHGGFSKGYTIEFFSKSYKGELDVDTPKDDYVITDKQRDMFADFDKNKARYSKQAFKALLTYIDNLGDYKDYFDNHDIPKTEKEMGDIVTPKQLIVNGERNVIIDCNAKWDNEHGVTIQIIPHIACGDLGKFY